MKIQIIELQVKFKLLHLAPVSLYTVQNTQDTESKHEISKLKGNCLIYVLLIVRCN